MKVLSLATFDWGGSAYFLSQAIRQTTEHKCRAVRISTPAFAFPHDLLNISEKNVDKLLNWCDVIHIHDAFDRKEYDKPVVMTYHGTRYRNNYWQYNELLETRGWFGSVSTIDLTIFGLSYIPNCRPDLIKYYDPPDVFTVVHAPTNREYKGTERVIEACERMNIPLVLIEDKPWEECLRMKGRAHVLVDQFTFAYGNNAIEAWSMGMPVVSDAYGEVEAAMFEIFGYCPYVKAGDDLEGALDRLKQSRSWREDWAATGRAHYLEWHSYTAVAQKAIELYEQVI